MDDVAATIRRMAQEHGFDVCYFARPRVPERDGDALDDWLQHGYQADMAWMGEAVRVQRRKTPASLLDGVQTVICLAMRHVSPPHALNEQTATQGVIASYAYGVDYHEVMKKRMKALARALDEVLGAHEQRVFVDTAPVLEHALAAAAGLGWQGKHSLTIHRQYGSYMMLGEIFTMAWVDADAVASAHCGSCTACLDVCPTQAIVAPYVVDANRCISYLTIEHQGVIPRELRPLMGAHIYGCDDCQMVCPWNRKVDACDTDILQAKGEHILPELASFLALDDAAFRVRFRKSPIKRTGRNAFLRNVCVAMGNSGVLDFIPVLRRALQDESVGVRVHAVWALHRLMHNDWEGVMQAMEADGQNEAVLHEIAACRQARMKAAL